MADEKTRQRMENDWFAHNEVELIRQARREHDRRMQELERQQQAGKEKELRELHWLKCPKCGHDMTVLDMNGVEVDRCTRCEGIFLDKGELMDLAAKQLPERQSMLRRLIGI
jgi:hypothetical protein